MRSLPIAFTLIAVVSSSSCASLDELKGPVVFVDPARLASDRASACVRSKGTLVSRENYSAAALAAGMLPDDFEAIRRAVDELDAVVTFRDSNQACEPHLRAGMESKGHDVMTKTFTRESLPSAFEYLAGTVSTMETKPRADEQVSDPLAKRYLTKDGKPLTCDYDMMDMIEVDGRRIAGESGRDLAIRASMNAHLPLRGLPAHRVDRIKHGAQDEYLSFLRVAEQRGDVEKVHVVLLKPENPLTVFDEEGRVYRLPELEDAIDFYRCVGAELRREWNLKPRPL